MSYLPLRTILSLAALAALFVFSASYYASLQHSDGRILMASSVLAATHNDETTDEVHRNHLPIMFADGESLSASPTATVQSTASPTSEATPTSTLATTNTPNAIDTPVPTAAPTNTPISTGIPVSTSTPTSTDTPEPTSTPTNTPELTSAPTDTLAPTSTVPNATATALTRVPTATPIPSTGRIGGQIWLDKDRDGNDVIDGDDTPIETVVVVLTDEDGDSIETITNDRGYYLFDDLPLGAYQIVVDTTTLPVGLEDGMVYDPDEDPNPYTTISADTRDLLDENIVYYPQLGSVGGQIWRDDDQDGNDAIDGDDFPLAGVIVNLFDQSGTLIATEVTDANGDYLFESLLLGTYTVRVDTSTLPIDVERGDLAYDVDGGDDNLSTVTLDASWPDNHVQEFAYYVPPGPVGSIGGQLWRDDDQDGNNIIDGDDIPLAGIEINLLGNGFSVIGTDATDSSGTYLFENVPYGTYTIEVNTITLPTPLLGNAAYHPDGGNPYRSTASIDLVIPDNLAQNFAYYYDEFFSALGGPFCYAVADSSPSSGPDTLVKFNLLSEQVAVVGSTNTADVEAIAFSPDEQTLYAADGGLLGTLDLSTGTFSAIGSFGSANGRAGTIDITDVDGLTFGTDRFFGVHRRLGVPTDLLFEIDPATGAVVTNAFGNGIDYVEIPITTAGDDDIDDIAADPYTGVLYGLANSGALGATLIEIDKTSGAITELATLGLNDIEGLSFLTSEATSTLYGSGGNNGPVESDNNKLYHIDKASGVGTFAGAFPVSESLRDYEALACTYDTDATPGPDNTPRIDIVKTAGDAADGEVYTVQTPGLVNFTYVVTNVGGSYFTDMEIIDDAGTPADPADDVQLDASTCAALAGPLSPSGFVICTAQIQVDATAINVALVTGIPTNEVGTPLSGVEQPVDSDAAEVVIVSTSELGSIGDTIFHDATADGVVDPADGDFPLAGVIVNLLDASGAVVATAATDANGNYLFTDLPLGQAYTIIVDTATLPADKMLEPSADPDGGADSMSMVALTASYPNNFDQDFGYAPILGSIGDQVWQDDDQDGNNLIDGDDRPIDGVVINLLDSNGTLIGVDVTDADGRYLFDSLLRGTYTVLVDPTTLPVDVVGNHAYDPDGGDDDSSVVTLTAATPDNLAQDFAYFFPTGSIGDLIFHDADANGVYDPTAGDFPIPGVAINLFLANGNVIATTTTDANGNYLFFDVPLDVTYTVVVDTSTLPYNKVVTPSADPDGGADSVSQVTLTATLPDDLEQDFGYTTELVTALGNYVWLDRNANGIQELNEPGLESIVVSLLDADGNVLNTTFTNLNGFYLFSNLIPGDYAISVELPNAGFQFSPANQVDDAFDSDVDPQTGKSSTITLVSSQTDLSWDVGIFAPPYLKIEKDATTTTVQPGNILVYKISYHNVGISQATGVELTEMVPENTTFIPDLSAEWACAGGAITAGTECRYDIGTLAAGQSSIEDVTFVVRLDADVDAAITQIDNTAYIAEDGLNGPSPSGLLSDSAVVTIDHLPGLSLGDRVWLDANNNGNLDNDESGIGGVTLVLWTDDDGDGLPDTNTGRTTISAADGTYKFTGLGAGDYVIQIPLTNFGSDKPLEGLESSSGNDPAPDPDNNVNNDDNGLMVNAVGILNPAIRLSLGDEPIDDGDSNPDTNLSLDFGFFEPEN